MSRKNWSVRPASLSRTCLRERWWVSIPAVCSSPPCITKTVKKSSICWWLIPTSPPAQSSIDCPLIELKKPLVHQSVHQFTPRVHHGCREKCAIEFQPRRSDSAGLLFWKLYIQIWDSVRNHRVLFFALTTPTKQVQWALFLFSGTGTKNFFEKVWESRKKIRQRESEKAMSLPWTLKTEYTFNRYIPDRGWKPQPDEGAPRTSCPQGLSRKARLVAIPNHSEISACYG